MSDELEALIWAYQTGKYPGIDNPTNYGEFLAYLTIQKVRRKINLLSSPGDRK